MKGRYPMRFRKQWLALLLTTAMTAANLTLPYSAVGALAAETQTVEENVPEEQNADGEISEQTDEDQDLSMPSGDKGDDDSAAPGGSSLSDEEAEEAEEAGSDNEEMSNGDLENAESDSGEESDAYDADKNSPAPDEEDAEDQQLENEDQQSNDGVSTEAQNAGDIETPEIGTDDAAQTGERMRIRSLSGKNLISKNWIPITTLLRMPLRQIMTRLSPGM